MSLTDGCSGTVKVSVGSKSGYVCRDTWLTKRSNMLCKNLGCGQIVEGSEELGSKRSSREMMMVVMSLHTPKHTTNLNQSVIVLSDQQETSCIEGARVVCSGDTNIPLYNNCM